MGAAVGLLLAGALTVPAQAAAVDEVDVFTGTGGQAPWFNGGTTPAASRPFGMVQWGPDTSAHSDGRRSSAASGYHAADTRLRGFSATHFSGAGCPILGDVPVLPIVGSLPSRPGAATVGFSHASESAAPGRYGVKLGNGVKVAGVAHDRSALMRFDFPTNRKRGRLLIKASGSLNGNRTASIRFVDRRTVDVRAYSGGFCRTRGSYAVNVRLRFNRDVWARRSWGGTRHSSTYTSGRGTGGWVEFKTHRKHFIKAQVAVSFVDPKGAAGNLSAARLGWDLARAQRANTALWNRELGRVQPTGGTSSQRRTLRTAVYRVLQSPMLVSDADRRYPGFDGRIHTLPSGQRQFTGIAGWDTYRTQMPLLAWLRPDIASQVVGSLQRAAKEGGWMPRWPVIGAYTSVMNGDSPAPVVASAYAFGARSFDRRAAVDALLRSADDTTPTPGQGWFVPRPRLADYLRLGYVPNDDPELDLHQPHGGSTTLEYAVDDFALGQLARADGRPEVADRMLARSGAWRHLLDPVRRTLLPRDAAGNFPGADYRTGWCCDGFQEGTAEQYTWAVPQDMAGLLSGLGTPTEVTARLDRFFGQLNAGGGGQAWMGNQPSLAVPWAYHWLGRPWQTQQVIDRVRSELWRTGPSGIPGNDDLGSLSAWYVWASIGVFPLTPGTSDVALTVPSFSSITIDPSAGSSTRIVRSGSGGGSMSGSGAFVDSVRVDGVDRPESWLALGPAERPREIVVTTTPVAGDTWGSAPEHRPRSWPADSVE